MPSCIYCGRENQGFDREHVIPQAFGSFEPNSFILYDAVCKECNNFFGRTLDFALSRDSMEALLRFRYGTKPASEAGDLSYHKLELKIGQSGSWLGATVVDGTRCYGPSSRAGSSSSSSFSLEGIAGLDFFRGARTESLVIYNDHFPGRMIGNDGYETWHKERYLVMYPTPPRSNSVLSDRSTLGFALPVFEDFVHEVEFEPAELANYLLTQTNVINAIEGGEENIESIRHWLLSSIEPFFVETSGRFDFWCEMQFLRRE